MDYIVKQLNTLPTFEQKIQKLKNERHNQTLKAVELPTQADVLRMMEIIFEHYDQQMAKIAAERKMVEDYIIEQVTEHGASVRGTHYTGKYVRTNGYAKIVRSYD